MGFFVVSDVEAELARNGVEACDAFRKAGGVFHRAGNQDRAPGPDSERLGYAWCASFTGPEGNDWILQKITERLAGRCHRIEDRAPNWAFWYTRFLKKEQNGGLDVDSGDSNRWGCWLLNLPSTAVTRW
ncbi:hypothetical protein [Streptomyces sp. NPDC055134]